MSAAPITAAQHPDKQSSHHIKNHALAEQAVEVQTIAPAVRAVEVQAQNASLHEQLTPVLY
ncbi:hypothetical protein BDZ89DRAFT_1075757 [Hymenopellis radicata]|nr:hypothetical protein BDZ89DRAFT_1075757 [Hymenopellis radicata]